MSSVRVMNYDRMKAIEDQAFISARLDGDNLVLIAKNGTETIVGNVRGEEGDPGPGGSMTGPGSSVDDQLAFFNGTSGNVLKTGRLKSRHMEQDFRVAQANWEVGRGDAGGVNFPGMGVVVNNPMALRAVRTNNTTLSVYGGVGLLAQYLNLDNNRMDDLVLGRLGVDVNAIAGSRNVLPTSPATTYRHDYLVAEFSTSGLISIVLKQGVGNNVSFATAPYPGLTDNQLPIALIKVTNGLVASAADVIDQRRILPSSMMVGTNVAASKSAYKLGQLVYDTTDKKFMMRDEYGELSVPWNLPRGVIARNVWTTGNGASVPIGGWVDVPGSDIVFIGVLGRAYKVTYKCSIYSDTTAAAAAFGLFTSGNAQLDSANLYGAGAGIVGISSMQYVHTVTVGGAQALKIRLHGQSGTGLKFFNHAVSPMMIMIEDMGPASVI